MITDGTAASWTAPRPTTAPRAHQFDTADLRLCPIEIAVPRARLNTTDGKTTEWKSKAPRAYQRRTLAADALIAGTYLAGTNTRRVRRALGLTIPHNLIVLADEVIE